jgi:hypothetical protein
MAKASHSLPDQWVDLDKLVAMLEPDFTEIDHRFRRALLDGSLADEKRTSPDVWRGSLEELDKQGRINWEKWPGWMPMADFDHDRREYNRYFYMPRFRRGQFLTLFHDLVLPAVLKEFQTPIDLDPYRTGLAGRPTPADIIRAELRRRIRDGKVPTHERGLYEAVCNDLWQWWETTRQTFDPPGRSMKLGSIRNACRKVWLDCIK